MGSGLSPCLGPLRGWEELLRKRTNYLFRTDFPWVEIIVHDFRPQNLIFFIASDFNENDFLKRKRARLLSLTLF